MTMDLRTEATELGESRGWDHANYVNAYGGDMYAAPDVPAWFESVATYYTAAYADGVERYEFESLED